MTTKTAGDRLQEQKASAVSQLGVLTRRAEGREPTASEQRDFDALEAELNDVCERINQTSAPTVASVPERGIRSTFAQTGLVDPYGYRRSFLDYMVHGDNMSSRSRDQLIERRAQLDRAELREARTGELRALGDGTGTAGGFLVPQGFVRQITTAMKAYGGGVINVANIIETPTGNTLPWPTNDDSANIGSILGENTQVTEVDLTFGTRSLNAWTYTSNLLLASKQLMQDAAFDVEGFIGAAIGRRIGRAVSAHFATGSGTNQPQGIATAPRVGVVGAVGETASISYADVVNLIHSVDAIYRMVDPTKPSGAGNRNPGCCWLVSDGGMAMLERLTAPNGAPLLLQKATTPTGQILTPNLANAPQMELLGFPIVVDHSLPAPGPSVIGDVMFGNFKAAYIVRQVVSGVEVVRLTERYADFNQIGFFGLARLDGRVNDTQAYAAFQHSAT